YRANTSLREIGCRGDRPSVVCGSSARTIANFAFDRKEETPPLAGRQFARDSLLGVGDEVLKGRESANYSYGFFPLLPAVDCCSNCKTGDDGDPRPIRIERRACRRRHDNLFVRVGEDSNLASRLNRPKPDSAVLR